MNQFLFILFCLFASTEAFGQNAVRIHFRKLGKERTMEVYPGDRMEYKLGKDIVWRKDIVAALNDSLLIFRSGVEIPFHKIKCIKVHIGNHLSGLFSGFFAGLSVMFISLDTFNNIILQRAQVLNPKAVIVSVAFAGASILVHRAGYRKVRIRKNTVIIPITTNYRNMGGKQ